MRNLIIKKCAIFNDISHFVQNDKYYRNLFKYAFLLSFVSFVSCVEEIDMTTFEHDSNLVVNSLFSPDSNFYVRVSKSAGIGSEFDQNYFYDFDTANEKDPEWYGLNRWYCDAVKVDDATVEIWENGSFVENLIPGNFGLFYSNNFSPTENNNYEIRVSAPGFTIVTSEDSVPEKVVFSNVEYTYLKDY